MAKKRPLVELEVSDVENPTPAVKATALVDQPAIEEAWLIFGKQQGQKPFEFETVSEERRLVMGPAMIPDIPIFRSDENGEYDVFFRKPTIEKIIKKWGKAGFHNCFNLMHNSDNPTNGVYLFESIMVDKERGIKTPSVFKKEYNDGTWIITLFVEDDVLWEEYIKTGRLQGFSVEGFFNMVFSKPNEFSESIDSALNAALSRLARVL